MNKMFFQIIFTVFGLTIASCRKTVSTQNYQSYVIRTPNDSSFLDQWSLKKIEAPSAWGYRVDCSSIIVAIVDTGVYHNHPDLQANMWHDSTTGLPGKNLTSTATSPFNPTDDNYHGTHVAGTIGATGNNAAGVTGICWQAQLMAVKSMFANGSGTDADISAGIDYAVSNGAKVINLSLGGTGTFSSTQTSITAARNAGVIVVAAAGNSGTNNDRTPFYPANFTDDNIISVAATQSDDTLASFSNYGPQTVDIAAPGVSILSTLPTVSTSAMTSASKAVYYDYLQGTSMAAPHVSGAAALYWAQHPTYTYLQVINFIYTNSAKISGIENYISGGKRLRIGPVL
jgi:subtilisin family serine protease